MEYTSKTQAQNYLTEQLEKMRESPRVVTESQIDLSEDYFPDQYDMDVLIVEDDKLQRDLNRDLMENSDIANPRVISVPNELTAWGVLRNGYLPDIVMTDRDLRKTGGNENGGDILTGAIKAGTPWEDRMESYETPYVVMYSGNPPDEADEVNKLLDEAWKKDGNTEEKIENLLERNQDEGREEYPGEYGPISIPEPGKDPFAGMENLLEDSRKEYSDHDEDVMVEATPVLRDAKSTANMIKTSYKASLNHIKRYNSLIEGDEVNQMTAQGALVSAAYGLANSKMAFDEFLQKEQLMSVALDDGTYSDIKKYGEKVNNSMKSLEIEIDERIEEIKKSDQKMHQGLVRIMAQSDDRTETNLPGILDWNDPKEDLTESLHNIEIHRQ